MSLFRNLRIWTLDAPLKLTAGELDYLLQEDGFQPCASTQAESIGWEPPVDSVADLTRSVSGCTILRARIQKRVLPARAVQEAAAEVIAKVESEEGQPVKGARRREIIDAVRLEMLPKAPLQSTRNWLVIDHLNHRILIDSPSASRCEAILSLLRGGLGNLGVRPLAFARPIDGSLTTWLQSGDLPDSLELGHWADLEHPQDTPNKVRFRCQPLDEEEVTATLDRGLRVTALELSRDIGADEPVRFVLSDDGAFRRVRIPAGDTPNDDESEATRLDADIAVAMLSLRRVFAGLFPALGGVVAE